MCNLGFWVNKQRKDKRSGSLLPDREHKLQELVESGLFKWNMHFSAAEVLPDVEVDIDVDIDVDENENENENENDGRFVANISSES